MSQGLPGTLHRALVLSAVLLAPVLRAQVPDLQARLASVEGILARFYRGESLDAGHRRIGALVDAYNAQVKQTNEALAAAKAQVDRDVAPGRQLAADLDAQEKALATPPDPSDREGVKRFNALVDARNDLVAKYNQVAAAGQQAVEAYNARLQQQNATLEQARAKLEAERQAFQDRSDAYAAFQAQGRDVAFFTALNRLLADLRGACRAGADPGSTAALEQVRGYRRELARWAAEHQAAQDHGLVLVTALVGDEPCCLILDTGAQVVCLPRELVDALDLTASLGEETTLSLAGGRKTKGRSIQLPRIAIGSAIRTQVDASAVAASDVGIDGLLGQSFLKSFKYTVDAGQLTLVPR
jgi:clan AA aspartic protease (TIGR02281 family)